MGDPLETLRDDPVMARLIDEHGPVEISPADHEYQRLAVSIINQQLSTASANAVQERVFELFDEPITPNAMLTVEENALREAGVSRQKVEYLRNTAEAFRRKDYTRSGLKEDSDETVVERLTEIRGVGKWTARMYLIFVLGRKDVLPLGDLAIRNGIDALYGDGTGSMTREEMRAVADRWRPYRSYGTEYVWRAYESD
ncbi:DNA-3-methyladenine glycosylase family protein [Natranaeroarchaeum sulfidigenes]|uniref:3-methyladenine DNA glycosylase/8-oxoguanine DNAglycosylase n=1 Tax=Natranaeroarchaeum sulfidigenes TaxID=2784880 RepID=A0A897MW57_9EURY|nr:DNA-3-methyladenine glycosylase 2 family protein [Natranaeroarchaeum sulfidigenes]QSG03149.1 3-methyladenine DNA glycosylase/8-oxoguanine DNAglycosylase [Natranaeroarchaeum sulfidigenes]